MHLSLFFFFFLVATGDQHLKLERGSQIDDKSFTNVELTRTSRTSTEDKDKVHICKNLLAT